MTFQIEDLVGAARAQTNLTEFDSDSYLPGLEQLVSSLEAEAELNDLGRLVLEGLIVTNLSNRLRVANWVAGHPAVAEEVIEHPVFILGLPRTGTTLLSYLLHQEP